MNLTTKTLVVISIGHYAEMLNNAIDAIEEQLPDEFKRAEQSALGRENVVYPILKPLYDLKSSIFSDLELLLEDEE